MTHTMVALVADHPGVLTRVASLFRRRGFNIESLAVGASEEPGYSRMTIAVNGTAEQIKQCEKQLYKLIEVVTVRDLTEAPRVERELALVKVRVTADQRPVLADIADIFHGEVVNIGRDTMIVQLAGDSETIDRFLEVVGEYGVEEISRTGVIAMAREPVTVRGERASA
ncbi:MAG: acetolactate synthase small subunit [Actinobacteria bacterium]|nr:acetolactate synthase small subunit [Actinomycetota bacterium]